MDPSERTVALYQEIRSGRLIGHRQAIANGDVRTSQEAPPTLEEALHHLQQLQTTAVEAEHRLQEAIHTVEAAMNGHKRSFYLLTCAKIDAGETLERRHYAILGPGYRRSLALSVLHGCFLRTSPLFLLRHQQPNTLSNTFAKH
jgi:hypothetical protein